MLLLLLITIGRKGKRGNGEGKGKTRKTIYVLDNSQKDEKRVIPLLWDSVPCMGKHMAFIVSRSLLSPLPWTRIFYSFIYPLFLPPSFSPSHSESWPSQYSPSDLVSEGRKKWLKHWWYDHNNGNDDEDKGRGSMTEWLSLLFHHHHLEISG